MYWSVINEHVVPHMTAYCRICTVHTYYMYVHIMSNMILNVSTLHEGHAKSVLLIRGTVLDMSTGR